MVSPNRSALLLSVIGMFNTIGRLFFGFLSDLIARSGHIGGVPMTALALNNICVILAGFTVLAVPFCSTFVTLMTVCCLFGLFICKWSLCVHCSNCILTHFFIPSSCVRLLDLDHFGGHNWNWSIDQCFWFAVFVPWCGHHDWSTGSR